MTGVGFILSGYLGSLFGWNMSQTAQILVAIGVMAVCMLINMYGVRFATMVNNIGVSLEFVITVGATILVAIVAFSSPDNHQSVSVLFTGGESDGSSSLRPGLAGRVARPLLRTHRSGGQRRHRRGDRQRPPRHSAHDVLRIDRLDRHRVR